MTPRQIARTLQNKHVQRSWRRISNDDYYGQIPAGTLARIAKTDGEYFPRKWASMFGIVHARPRCLFDMSEAELLFAFTHRVEM